MPYKDRATATANQRRYRAENWGRIKEQRRQYRKANPDKIRAYKRIDRAGCKPTRPEPTCCEVCGRPAVPAGV